MKRENAGKYVAGGFRLLHEHVNAFLADGAERLRKAASDATASRR